ncbi:MAG: MBL fold metallo-hydrolase [Sphingomonadales bacterium]|nr:MBL fold metallo-hydrolase [Sphingomonadales bacterium]
MPELTIGHAGLHRIEELRIPNKIGYFTQDAALIDAHRHWLEPHFLSAAGGFDLVFQSWVFETAGRVVLVDPCTGNGKPHVVPFFDMLDTPFIERLEQAGFRPDDVDIVVCTHLHHDHCGWNTMLRGGNWVPTFPKARYVMQRAEVDRWGRDRHLHPAFAYNDGVFERSVQPVLDAGLAEIVTGKRLLAPGLTVEHAPGHTSGHQLLHLVSDQREALFTGDCFHHPIQLVDPGNPFGDAEDPVLLAATRRQLAQRAADSGALLIPAHLPAPYAVRAWHENGAIRFAAANTG